MPDPTLPPCRHSGTRSRCPSRQEAAPEATDARDARKAGRSAIHARHPLLATNAHRVLAAFVLAPGSSNSPRGASMLVPRWRRTAPTAESRAAPIAQEQLGQRGRRGCFLGEAVISAAAIARQLTTASGQRESRDASSGRGRSVAGAIARWAPGGTRMRSSRAVGCADPSVGLDPRPRARTLGEPLE